MLQNPSDKILSQQVARFIWPAILANLSTPLLSLGDTAIIGHFGTTVDLAAIGAGGAAISMLVWVFGFLRMGTTGEVARASGLTDDQQLSRTLTSGFMLALSIGLCTLVATQFGASTLSQWINPDNPSSALTHSYIQIRSLGLPAVFINMIIAGWLIGTARPAINLAIVSVCNVLNLALNVVAVAVLDSGAIGIAWSTVIAEYTSTAIGLIYYWRNGPTPRLLLGGTQLQRFLHQNLNLLLRSALLVFAMTFFTAQSARLGDDLLATNTLLVNLVLLVSYFMDGVANAVETLCGRAVGAQQWAQFRRVFTIGCKWSLLFGIGFSLMFATSQTLLPTLLTNDLTVQTLYHNYSTWLIVFPLVSVWAYFFDGVFIGAGHIAPMRNTVAIATISYIGLWLGLSHWGFGNHYLWFCFLLKHGIRGGGLALYAYILWFKAPLDQQR